MDNKFDINQLLRVPSGEASELRESNRFDDRAHLRATQREFYDFLRAGNSLEEQYSVAEREEGQEPRLYLQIDDDSFSRPGLVRCMLADPEIRTFTKYDATGRPFVTRENLYIARVKLEQVYPQIAITFEELVGRNLKITAGLKK